MIIGIVGLIGSGKGTVGDILVQDYGWVAESFAKPLKDAVATIFDWPRHLLEGDTKESREWRENVDSWWSEALGWEVTPRLILQKMGTEAGRNVFGKPLWTSALIKRLSARKNYVITDVRFVNEIEALKGCGGHVIRVRRGPEPDWFPVAQEFLKTEPHIGSVEIPENGRWVTETLAKLPHRSEWDWVNSQFDSVIYNDGSLDDLKKAVHSTIGLMYMGR
jgi:hypothetical protein